MTVLGNIIFALTSKINAIYVLNPVLFSDLVPTHSEIKDRPINLVQDGLDLKPFKRYKMLHVNNL